MDLRLAPRHQVRGKYTHAEYAVCLIVAGFAPIKRAKSLDEIAHIAAAVPLTRDEVEEALDSLVSRKYLLAVDDGYLRAPHVVCRKIVTNTESFVAIVVVCKNGDYSFLLPEGAGEERFSLARMILDAEAELRPFGDAAYSTLTATPEMMNEIVVSQQIVADIRATDLLDIDCGENPRGKKRKP